LIFTQSSYQDPDIDSIVLDHYNREPYWQK